MKRENTATNGKPTGRLAYRVAEVASLTGAGESTVRDWVRQGTLRGVKVGTGRRAVVLIPADALDELLAPARESR